MKISKVQLLLLTATLCLTATTASQSNSTQFNVKDYGARGDGASDDQSAIMSTAAAAKRAGGGTIWFPPGTYLHSDLLDFGSNITVLGVNTRETILKATNPIRSALRFQNASGCRVSNLKIVGAPSPRKQNDESVGILLTNASHCTISGVSIDGGASAGILLHGSQDVQISGNDIRNEMADGVHIVAGSRHVLIENNTAYNTGDDSFAAVAYAKDPQTSDVTIRNNTSIRSRARGATCIGASNCVITGNKIVDPASHGIAVAFEESYNTHHPRHATVANNAVSGVTKPGRNPILVDRADDVTLTQDRVTNSNSIYIHGSSNVTVENLQIHDSKGAAILARDSRDLKLRGNQIVHSSGSGIVLERSMVAK